MQSKIKRDKILDGKWWKIKNNVIKKIEAKYNKIKDWKMDPKGYFLIKIDKENDIIRVGYCKFNSFKKNELHEMVTEITGKTAIEIVNTLIKKNYISTLQHAGDMGIELHKAEIALKNDLNYFQDKDIDLKKLIKKI